MDHWEKVTYKFLTSSCAAPVVFEPLGKAKAPDFAVDGRIAVETTRLTKMVDFGGTPIDLKDFQI